MATRFATERRTAAVGVAVTEWRVCGCGRLPLNGNDGFRRLIGSPGFRFAVERRILWRAAVAVVESVGLPFSGERTEELPLFGDAGDEFR